MYRPATQGDCGDFEVIALEGLGIFPDRNVHAQVSNYQLEHIDYRPEEISLSLY